MNINAEVAPLGRSKVVGFEGFFKSKTKKIRQLEQRAKEEPPSKLQRRRKRRTCMARAPRSDQKWWTEASQSGLIISYWLQTFGLKETYWLAGDDQEALVDAMVLKLNPAQKRNVEDPFERNLREKEEAMAAERALRNPAEAQQPSKLKPQGKKAKAESKLDGLAQSSKQHALTQKGLSYTDLEERGGPDWRTQQEAEFARNQPEPETVTAFPKSEGPRYKRGRTEEKEAERALAAAIRDEKASKASSARRHVKKRASVKPGVAVAPKPKVEPPVVPLRIRLRRDMMELELMSLKPHPLLSTEAQIFFRAAHDKAHRILQAREIRFSECGKLMEELRGINTLAEETWEQDIQLSNPLLTLANLLARVMLIPM